MMHPRARSTSLGLFLLATTVASAAAAPAPEDRRPRVDYLDFAQAFNDEDPSADFNGDNQVDFFDYLDFAAAFDAQC